MQERRDVESVVLKWLKLMGNQLRFKKLLLDAEISLSTFSQLIKLNDKNLQTYKKKDEAPNTIAVIARCFAEMNKMDIHVHHKHH